MYRKTACPFAAMEEEEEDARYEFEERDGRRLKFFAGEPGN